MREASVDILDRHQARRDQGEATISVLRAETRFVEWAAARGRAVVTTDGAAVLEAVEAVVVPADAFQPCVVHDSRSARLRTHQRLPAVLVRLAPPAEAAPLAAVIEAALEVPRLPLGLLVSEVMLGEWLAGPLTRETTLLQEGLGSWATEVAERSANRVAAMNWLRRRSSAAVPKYLAAVLAPAETARSAAEALLFELLELEEETRGEFVLNAPQAWQFGPRAGEADLFSARRQVAIEVDGYHHFADAEAYRRDRRKDVQYQLHGVFVVRVLAQDLVDDVRDTFETLVRTLRAVERARR